MIRILSRMLGTTIAIFALAFGSFMSGRTSVDKPKLDLKAVQAAANVSAATTVTLQVYDLFEKPVKIDGVVSCKGGYMVFFTMLNSTHPTLYLQSKVTKTGIALNPVPQRAGRKADGC